MSIIESLQKSALLAAIDPDGEAVLRNLFRWFSKTFHTPLADVEEMPVEYILQHYFESQYEELENEDKHNLIIFLLETPEEREARKKHESQNEENFIKEAEAEAASGLTLQDQRKKLNKPLIQKAMKNIEAIEKAMEAQEIKISFVEEIPDRDALG